MRQDRMSDLALFVIFAVARSNQPRKYQRDHTALHVYYGRTGEIHVAMADTEVRAEVGEPAVAPDPVPENRIHADADAAAIDHERGESPPLGCSARWDGRGRVHEHHLEKE